jgi:hypothetical protein
MEVNVEIHQAEGSKRLREDIMIPWDHDDQSSSERHGDFEIVGTGETPCFGAIVHSPSEEIGGESIL